ncbi:ATP-binding cassette domain-containing protein [Chromobacterium vaccinii]|uniref:ATP-binding cassette domain-containing protein n=1 Tax=Chromobacterium vaccinii TaxID=1108595 RepID=UPI000E13A75E|nr:ATP-binding cassette domain-containing protein [Chromobacterium vaccinii]SUX28426.1 Putative multidrug export ATP-binding/permease protein SAV1866 [Chromobacterium vaccinii]
MLQLHGERVADIVLTPPENTFDIVESDFKNFSPAIEVRNVSFRYADCEEYILKNFSLLIPSGQCIAITGASGCGKTTLLKLILGLLEPTSGDIFVSGISIKQFGLFNYRKTLGSVMQEDQLFSGSIFDNISFFDPQPDLEHAQKCAKLSAIHDEIIAMPMSYNTLVGDIGSTLSGGQKQRLLLARALYKNPQILVLDEATSHLDIWNEKLVNSAIADNK